MTNRRAIGYIFFFTAAILFIIGGVWTAINMPPLGLVLAAVIIIAAMIFIYRLPENRYKNIAVLTNNEKQEIAGLKNTIEKIKTLEEEKKRLLIEIHELKEKMSEA